MAGGWFQDRHREGKLLWPRTGLGSFRKSFAPLPAPVLVADRIWEVALAVQSAVRNLQRDLRQDLQRDLRNGLRTGQLGAISAMAAIATLGRAVTSASTVPEGALGEDFTEAEAVSTAVADDPILGLSTRSSCSATLTTALASVASFIMEAKKPMSE